VERLAEVGRWLTTNNEAVYGNGPSPFTYELPWGLITTKPGKLYLHVFDWPQKQLVLYGLKNKVQKAYLLANKQKLEFTGDVDRELDHHALRIQLPPVAPDKQDSIIVLDINEEPLVETSLIQQPDRSITLPAYLAEVHKGSAEQQLRVDSRGVIERWVNKEEWLSWDFKVNRPGTFDLLVLTSEQKYGRDWEGDHVVRIEVAGAKMQGAIANQGKQENPFNPYWKYVISTLGRVSIDKTGKYHLSLTPELIRSDKRLGLTLVSVKLLPVER
jgi:alpha-L-fucosidase